MVNIKMIEYKNYSKRDPEAPIGYKSAVAKIIAAFEFLETSDHLSQAPKYQTKCHDRPDITPSHIMYLQKHRRERKPCKTYNTRIPLRYFSVRHEINLLSENKSYLKIYFIRE
jgi:hypothetical protein